MAWNRGKDFELIVREQLQNYSEETKNSVDSVRLYDVTMGYVHIKNPSDLIVYKKPNMFYWECKSTEGNTLHFNRLTQLDDILDHTKTDGIIGGFFIWYIDHKETYWVNAKFVAKLKSCSDKVYKSLNIKDLREWAKLGTKDVILVESRTPRVNPVYNFETFFNTVIEE